MADPSAYRVWLALAQGGREYWSWEREDGWECGGNYPSRSSAEARALRSIADCPIRPTPIPSHATVAGGV